MMQRIVLLLLMSVFSASCADTSQASLEYEAKKAGELEREAAGEKSLFARFGEFTEIKAVSKPGQSRGPAAVIIRLPGGDWEMEGWKRKDDGSHRPCREEAGCKGGHDRVAGDHGRAMSGETVKTLVRVDCTKGKPVTDFKKGIVIGTVYAIDCFVEVIDLPPNTSVASTHIKADKVERVSDSDNVRLGQILMPEPPRREYFANPFPAIRKYVDGVRGTF